jgi:uncharacterized membrane protein YfhO
MKMAASIIRWIPLAIVAFAAVAAVALFQLDKIVNETLYSYGLVFSVDWAVPYWNTIRTTLAMLGLTIVIAVVILASAFFLKSGKKNGVAEENGSPKDKHWNTYKLSDGSTFRIKTVLKGVKRLNTYTVDGKPVYSVKADNMVEVVDAPRQLMKPNEESQDS